MWVPFVDFHPFPPELQEMQESYFGGSVRRTIQCQRNSVISARITAGTSPPCLSPADIVITVRMLSDSHVRGQTSFPLSALPVKRGSKHVLNVIAAYGHTVGDGGLCRQYPDRPSLLLV
jgi:hypothetical protein